MPGKMQMSVGPIASVIRLRAASVLSLAAAIPMALGSQQAVEVIALSRVHDQAQEIAPDFQDASAQESADAHMRMDELQQIAETAASEEARLRALTEWRQLLGPRLALPLHEIDSETFRIAARYAVFAQDDVLAAIVLASNRRVPPLPASSGAASSGQNKDGPVSAPLPPQPSTLPPNLVADLQEQTRAIAQIDAASRHVGNSNTLWQAYSGLIADLYFGEAAARIDALEDPDQRDALRQQLVHDLAEARRFTEAEIASGLVADPLARLQALDDLAAQLSDVHQFDAALALVAQMKNLATAIISRAAAGDAGEVDGADAWDDDDDDDDDTSAFEEDLWAEDDVEIDPASLITERLSEIAIQLTRADRLGDALSLVPMLADEVARDETLVRMAHELAIAGRDAEAATLIERISDNDSRREAQERAASAAAQRGALDVARLTALHIDDPADRAYALLDLLRDQNTGAQRLEQPEVRGRIIADAEQAVSTWLRGRESLAVEEQFTGQFIAIRLADAGALDSAERVVQSMSNPLLYIPSHFAVARALQNAGRDDEARRVADKVIARVRREQKARRQAGSQPSGEGKSVGDGFTSPDLIEKRIATGLAGIGEHERASAFVNAIVDQRVRVAAQHDLYIGAFAEENYTGALALARHIEVPGPRAAAAASVADRLLDAGHQSEAQEAIELALAAAASVKEVDDTAFTLTPLAERGASIERIDLRLLAITAGRVGRADAVRDLSLKIRGERERQAFLIDIATALTEHHDRGDIARALVPDLELDPGASHEKAPMDEMTPWRLAHEGRYPEARLAALALPDPYQQLDALISVAAVAAKVGILPEHSAGGDPASATSDSWGW